MEPLHNAQLTCSELGSLWATYMEESMTGCVYKYFYEVLQDPDIKRVLKRALELSERRTRKIGEIFSREHIPLPLGFTEKDVNANAPRLYSDIFITRYAKLKASFNMGAFSTGKSLSVREDIRQFYTECLMQASDMYDETVNLLLAKGVLVRAPILAYPKKVEFIERKSFLELATSGKRPLNSIEIAHLGANAETNQIGKVLILGFCQVAQAEELRDYFWRGKQLAEKLIEEFGSILSKDDIPFPASWDGSLSDSRTAPFSDKLMLAQVGILNVSGMGDCGVSLAASTRSDLIATYASIVAEIEKYASEGASLLVKNGWLEKPPRALDREELVKA